MKKICISVLLLAIMAVPALAYMPGLETGIKGGINYSVLDFAEVADSLEDYGLGISVGGGMKYHFGSQLNLGVDYLFSYKTSKLVGEVDSVDVELEYKLAYLELPVRLQFDFNNAFGIFAGAELGYLILADGEVSFGAFSGSGDIKSVFNDFNYGVNAGVAFRFDRIEITAGYSLGLVDIYAPSDEDVDLDGKLKSFFVNGYFAF